MKNKPYPPYYTGIISDLKELVSHAAEKYGELPAFTFERKKDQISIGYCQFKSDVDALGTALYDLSIQNTKVAVIGENSYEWILTYLAVVNGGNVIVPLDRELPPEDIGGTIADCGATVLVFSDAYEDVAEYLQNNGAMIGQYINMNTFSSLLEIGEALIRQGEREYISYKIDNQALAVILYTSGTTGIAKGVMLSHKSIASDVVAACQLCFCSGVSLFVLPLHHSFAFTSGILAMMHSGCNIVISKSLKNVSGYLKKYKPNNAMLVPLFIETFYKKVWDNAGKTGKAWLLRILIIVSRALLGIGVDVRAKLFKSVLAVFCGNIEIIIIGGAPIDSKYVKGFRDFGVDILNGYGITECSPIVSVNRKHYYRDGSVGQLLPGCEVKIQSPDESGNGEICVKGDNVMLGYYNNESGTKDAFDGEWFKTGDIGMVDEDGFLFISGRKKNMILLSNGKNVYPEDLEYTLMSVKYIKEAVVFAEGDIIVAEVFLNTENEPDCGSRLSSDIDAINRMLPTYKNIGKTVIRETEFPKTTMKKIKRKYTHGRYDGGVQSA